MCVNCFGESITLNNGEASNAQRAIDCDLTMEMIQELRLALETNFLKTKDKRLVPFIQEMAEYSDQFYTMDICSQLGRINVLRQEYL